MNGKDVLWDGKGNLQRIVRRIDQGAGELQSGTCSIDQHPNNHTDVATKAGGTHVLPFGPANCRIRVVQADRRTRATPPCVSSLLPRRNPACLCHVSCACLLTCNCAKRAAYRSVMQASINV